MASDSTENLRIVVESNPSQSRLSELGIKSWPKFTLAKDTCNVCITCEARWGCSPGKFQLKFDSEETCYFVKGKVKAYQKGSSEFTEFGAGDLVIIPKGLSCTWEVSVAVDKYYKFASSSPPPSTSAIE